MCAAREPPIVVGNWPTLSDIEECLCSLTFPAVPANNFTDHTGPPGDEPRTDYFDPTSATAGFQPTGSHCSSWWRAKDPGGSPPFTRSPANLIEDALYERVAVAVCSFGLLGNAVNLAVLSAQRYPSHAGAARMQRFARIGLQALAVADSMFCLLVLPHAFVERDPFTTSVNFSLFYSAYGQALINVFAMSGTWLTVGMALGRYAAVCHPFRARAAIGRTVALRAIVAVLCACALANVPRFLMNSIATVRCPLRRPEAEVEATDDERYFYFRWPGPLHARHNPELEFAYFWAYFVAAFVIPLVLLLFTGCRLAFRLRRTRRDAAAGVDRSTAEVIATRGSDLDRPFTVTLVAVAAMHVVLVSPAELLSFARWRLLIAAEEADASRGGVGGGDDAYNLLAAVLNTLQAANYSLNFLLYCAVNVAFRRRFVELVSCRGPTSVENHVRLQLVLSTGALDRNATLGCSGRRERRVTVLPDADMELDRLTGSETS